MIIKKTNLTIITKRRWRYICGLGYRINLLFNSNYRANIFHFHNPTICYAYMIKLLTKIPSVITIHGLPGYELKLVNYKYWMFKEILINKFLKYFNKIITVHGELKEIIENFYKIQDKDISVITHGVDTRIFNENKKMREYIRESLKIKDDELLISCFKTIPKDDYETVLKALNKLKIGTKIKFLIPNRANDRKLEFYLTLPNIKKKVIVPKTINYSKMMYYYNASDIIICPYVKKEYNLHRCSKIYNKGNYSVEDLVENQYLPITNLTVLESLACGIPTIISAPNASIDFSKNDPCIIFRAWDYLDLIKKIELLISHEDIFKSLNKKSIKFIQKYSWENTVNKILTIYNSCI